MSWTNRADVDTVHDCRVSRYTGPGPMSLLFANSDCTAFLGDFGQGILFTFGKSSSHVGHSPTIIPSRNPDIARIALRATSVPVSSSRTLQYLGVPESRRTRANGPPVDLKSEASRHRSGHIVTVC
jgi:hypothetical protein